METIDIRELMIKKELGTGCYSIVRECEFNGKIYAYKEFLNKRNIDSNLKKRLNILASLEEAYLITPKFQVKNHFLTTGYITEVLKGDALIKFYYNYNLEEIVKALQQAKKRIIELHNLGIIHGDIHHGNIILNEGIASIIDFDACSYKNIKLDKKRISDFAVAFINKFGIREELDISLLNYNTFSLINNCHYFETRYKIRIGDYGYFDNPEALEISRNLLLEDNYPTSEFLIDTIDIKRLTLNNLNH